MLFQKPIFIVYKLTNYDCAAALIFLFSGTVGTNQTYWGVHMLLAIRATFRGNIAVNRGGEIHVQCTLFVLLTLAWVAKAVLGRHLSYLHVCCVFIAACCLDSALMLLGNSTKLITRVVCFIMRGLVVSFTSSRWGMLNVPCSTKCLSSSTC